MNLYKPIRENVFNSPVVSFKHKFYSSWNNMVSGTIYIHILNSCNQQALLTKLKIQQTKQANSFSTSRSASFYPNKSGYHRILKFRSTIQTLDRNGLETQHFAEAPL